MPNPLYANPAGASGEFHEIGAEARSSRSRSFWLYAILLTLPFQFVGLGGVQVSQVVALMALAWLFLFDRKQVLFTRVEVSSYLVFLVYATVLTFFTGYLRIKAPDQLVKFWVVYPCFYVLGRWVACGREGRPPFGLLASLVLFVIQWAIQFLQVPVLYQTVDFMQDALYGSFKERNWFAIYFFFLTYLVYLASSRGGGATAAFLLFGVLVAVLSGSKTNLVASGIAVMLLARTGGLSKSVVLIAGTIFYVAFFGSELSGNKLAVKLEEERGLALQASLEIVGNHPMGYGFGYVESFFSNLWYGIRGLGEGTNSVFCSPLDMTIIAGLAGLAAWLVFFCGFGLGRRVMFILAPVAAWSLLNPLHQSEIVFFFIGFLISVARTARQ